MDSRLDGGITGASAIYADVDGLAQHIEWLHVYGEDEAKIIRDGA